MISRWHRFWKAVFWRLRWNRVREDVAAGMLDVLWRSWELGWMPTLETQAAAARLNNALRRLNRMRYGKDYVD